MAYKAQLLSALAGLSLVELQLILRFAEFLETLDTTCAK